MAFRANLHSPSLAVHQYSRRFFETVDDGHAAASPLGAWALLALLARGAPPEVRGELEQALGCDADEAFAYVGELCEQQHPAISLALGAWIHEDAFTPLWAEFIATLPKGVGGGAMPTRELGDAWMRKATRGRISKMPVKIDEDSAVLLASAIAMDGGWRKVLEVSEPGDLGPHELEGEFTRVLVQSEPHCALIRTAAAGVVGASVLETNNAFVVVSVQAAARVSRADTIAAAHEIASDWQRFERGSNVSLFDLPLGEGPDWTITESTYETLGGPERQEASTLFIPAWEITESRVNLLSNPRFGFAAACPALERLLKPQELPYRFEAAQLATARFHQLGFSAAAGTAFMGYVGASLKPTMCRERTLELRFHRPFAVVAMSHVTREFMHRKGIPIPARMAPHPWHGIPCFAAWVTRATEPEVQVAKQPDWA